MIPPLLLSHVEMPPAAIFGSVKPARLVGRSCEDGGMPIHVHPSRATVVPPLVLTVSCLERADTALAAAGAGEKKGRNTSISTKQKLKWT